MERLQTSTVPTSDSVATATVIDGFETEQIDQLGGSYAFTIAYSATGITSTSKSDLAGRTVKQTLEDSNLSIKLTISPASVAIIGVYSGVWWCMVVYGGLGKWS